MEFKWHNMAFVSEGSNIVADNDLFVPVEESPRYGQGIV